MTAVSCFPVLSGGPWESPSFQWNLQFIYFGSEGIKNTPQPLVLFTSPVPFLLPSF